MKNRAAWQRNLSHQRQTGRWGDKQPCCLPGSLTYQVTGLGSPLMTDYKSREAGSGRKKGRERKKRPPPPLELWEAAGLEKAKGRKGSGDSLLFELCVLWLQSQHTHLGLAIYILSISMQAEHRLQPFSSLHTLWRCASKSQLSVSESWLYYFFLLRFLLSIFGRC